MTCPAGRGWGWLGDRECVVDGAPGDAGALIALLFLVAGLLTPPSVQRKGPGGFARDRLLRLGVPFAVYVLILQPTIVYLLEHPLGAAPGSYWQEFLGDEGALDTGLSANRTSRT
jgi:hypothetical protein